MYIRYATAVIAMAIIPLTACGADDTVGDPGAANPPVVDSSKQPGVGDEGQGGASQESLEGRVGEQVQLVGEVATLITPNALTLGGDEIGENPILVIGADLPPNLTEGEQVRVSGTVQVFQVPGYEEDLDLDLVDQEFEDFDGDPAIQADSVTKVG